MSDALKKQFALLLFLWSAFALTAQQNPCACCSEEHSAFDFWLGSWDVKLQDGTMAGENRIEKIQGGCVLLENWKASNGNFTGTSYNFFNPETGLWEQLWLDTSGTILKLHGRRVGDQMILQSEPGVNEDGSETVQRITWTLLGDGSVTQVWEVLSDGVPTRELFNGLYFRKS